MNISVIICSVRRPRVLHETVLSVIRGSVLPFRLLLCIVEESDILRETKDIDGLEVVVSPRSGLTAQRNYAISHCDLNEDSVICFLDDDVELHRDYIMTLSALFRQRKELIGVSAHALINEDVGRMRASKVLEGVLCRPAKDILVRNKGKLWTAHGCNMAFRSTLFDKELFDEELPLYSFAEDLDISIRAARYGVVGKIDEGLPLIHLEVNSGRVSEFRRGYSMVANNLHFLKKGVSDRPLIVGYLRLILIIIIKESLVDVFLGVWRGASKIGRKEIDYFGRIKGRLFAILDIFLGKCYPRRILDLS